MAACNQMHLGSRAAEALMAYLHAMVNHQGKRFLSGRSQIARFRDGVLVNLTSSQRCCQQAIRGGRWQDRRVQPVHILAQGAAEALMGYLHTVVNHHGRWFLSGMSQIASAFYLMSFKLHCQAIHGRRVMGFSAIRNRIQ